jgi:CRISPR type III-A-associated protein Csm2
MKEALNKAGYKGSGNPQRQQGYGRDRGQSGGQTIDPPKIAFRANGQLRRELLTTEAEKWSDLLYDNKNGVTATQLRNFFNEVKALQSRIEAGGFAVNEAMIGLLKSKVAYAYARAEKKRKTGFEYLKSMIEQGADLSKSEEAFNDFALFFEAVMGFFKGR